MRQRSYSQQRLKLAATCIWIGLAGAALFRAQAQVATRGDDNCVACHRQEKGNAAQIVSTFQTSVHAKMGVGCNNCHGGDSSQSDKSNAHAGNFIAKPDTAATLEMCGKCHRQPLEFFKSSRHVSARPNAARLDCVECHGVHAIGVPSESFRWPQYCAGCHGLEYLPQLPKPFQEMLSLADDLREGLHRLELKGRAQPEMIRRRKDIRHMISELVHQTDAKDRADRIPRILELGALLKDQISAEEKR